MNWFIVTISWYLVFSILLPIFLFFLIATIGLWTWLVIIGIVVTSSMFVSGKRR